MSDVEFVDGLRVYAPREGAPSFIKASLVIERDALIAWLQGRGDTVRLDIKESRNGKLYVAVNNWAPRSSEPGAQPVATSGGGNPAQEATYGFKDSDIPFITNGGVY